MEVLMKQSQNMIKTQKSSGRNSLSAALKRSESFLANREVKIYCVRSRSCSLESLVKLEGGRMAGHMKKS